MEKRIHGPRISDAVFFGKLVDHSLEGLEGIRAAAEAGDFLLCRKIFATRIRRSLRIELYDQLESPGVQVIFKEIPVDVIAKADRICENYLESCGIGYQFKDVIDWSYNATTDGYVEWTWQLNRHPHWTILALAYRRTGDEKYAKCFSRQFESWVKQAVVPDDSEHCYGNQSLCWRSIETGLRMSGSFPAALHAFYCSPEISDDLLVDFYKSVWEHGNRLEKYHMNFNWLIMEMNGLGHIASMYPELKDSSRWYEFTVETLRTQLQEQVYADGMHGENSSIYHYIVIANYMDVLRTAKIYGKPMPGDIYDGVEKMLEVIVKIAQPNGMTPDLGDGHGADVSEMVRAYIKDFPQNQLLRWAASKGREGRKPEYTSVVLPYSGLAVLRTGWKDTDFYACFDGGPFGLCHQHQDKLNLAVYANGRPVIQECGTYAYDTSPMRRYAISTRGHNTARVNGMDQNRVRNILPEWSEMKCLSGIRTKFCSDYDYVSAIYEEGYSNEYGETAFQPAITPDGRLQDKDGRIVLQAELSSLYMGASHERGVMLVKKMEKELAPFLLVFDRFRSEDINDYEILWHFNTDAVAIQENAVSAEDFCIKWTETCSEYQGISLVRGIMYPECQGWRANSMLQGQYTPIWTVKTMLHGGSIRIVTLLYPDTDKNCPVRKIMASPDVESRNVTLLLESGKNIEFSEPL